MKQRLLAVKYVLALKDSAIGNDAEKILTQAIELCDFIASKEDVWEFFKSPIVVFENKKNVIQEIIKTIQADKLVEEFILLLLRKNRINILNELIHEMKKELNELLDQVNAEIIMPGEMSDIDKEAFINQIKPLSNKKLKVTYKIDPSIIGGFKIKIDNLLYDGSIQNALQKINESFN
jgi:F-type H+-transporting ATPase subunit delta